MGRKVYAWIRAWIGSSLYGTWTLQGSNRIITWKFALKKVKLAYPFSVKNQKISKKQAENKQKCAEG